MVSHISRTFEQERERELPGRGRCRGRFCEWVCVRNPRSEIRVRCQRRLARALKLIEEPPRHPVPNHGDFCKFMSDIFRSNLCNIMAMFLGLTHFQLSKSKGKHCAVVFFCGSASVVRPRPPPKTSERPVSLRPAVARSTTATGRRRRTCRRTTIVAPS